MTRLRQPDADAAAPVEETPEQLAIYHRHYVEGSDADLDFRLTRRLMFMVRRWRKVLDDQLRAHGHSQAQWEALFSIAMLDGQATLTTLAARLGLEIPSIVGLVERLERDGMIARTAHETDRRSRRISLTAAGLAAVEEMRDATSSVRKQLLHGISRAQRRAMLQIFTQMRDNLDDIPITERPANKSRGVK